MTLVAALHGRAVHPRRVEVLAGHAARLIPNGAHVLDVGTGDGRLAAAVRARRPDLRIDGVDVLVRPETAIPVRPFDGRSLPLPARSLDVVTLFDVLHHADDPEGLLCEAARVARRCVVIKDHVGDGRIARRILRFMDDVGNARHGVALPHTYWTSAQWDAAIARARLHRALWERGGLGLYPFPLSIVFGGRLHVMARLDVAAQPS